jgi:hypothetical protein
MTRPLVSLVLAAMLFAIGCPISRSEGVDPTTLPIDVRADYAVFAQRCSKCHSLARPLNSGIDEDAYWAMYVARMRAQPSSGISHGDTIPILRFLHYYSLDRRHKKDGDGDGGSPQPSAIQVP